MTKASKFPAEPLPTIGATKALELAEDAEMAWEGLQRTLARIPDVAAARTIGIAFSEMCGALVALREERRRLVGLAQANLQAKMKEIHS